jgi:hypothetical protein
LILSITSSTIVSRSSGLSTSNGTSFSSPLVAGLAAGYWQANPHLTVLEVIDRIKKSGHIYWESSDTNNAFGYGIPNFNRMSSITSVVENTPERDVKIYPNPFERGTFYIETGNFFNRSFYEIYIYDLNGILVNYQEIEKNEYLEREEININQLVAGNYIVRITDGESEYQSRLIKR